MQMRPWALIAGALLAVALVTGLSAGGPHSFALAPATPAGLASPAAAATPGVTQLPLYTPIPVSAGRNVIGQLTIEMTDRGFIPSRFEQAINQPITFTLVNTGTRRHTFSIDELDVAESVAPGEARTFTIPSPRRLGHYTYYSDTPEDKALGMIGTMTIFI